MLTFEDAYKFTETIGSHTSFEKEECMAYFEILMSLPPRALIVEVGLEYGRSSSIALQVCMAKDFDYCGIDIRPKEEWRTRLGHLAHALEFRFGGYFGADSRTVPIEAEINAILIDGDHSYEGVLADCEHFLPHIEIDGFAMLHDYKRESLPDVTRAADAYFSDRPLWTHWNTIGTLGIWRRN